MMKKEQFERFIERFTEQWLQLDNIQKMPPSYSKFRSYHTRGLKQLFLEETYQYMGYMFRNNRPISELFQSDYSFLNKNLGEFYGIKNINHNEIKYTKLPAESLRGGIIAQGSFLTATSNGVETSPIVRGVWIAENLLNRRIAAPPEDIEALEPDTRGAITVKQKILKHRENKNCAGCHKTFDPLGLSLENYNPVGQHRDFYIKTRRQTLKVESEAVSADGFPIKGISGLRAYLKKNERVVASAFCANLMSFALGRELTFSDLKTVNKIIDKTALSGWKTADILKQLIMEEPFSPK